MSLDEVIANDGVVLKKGKKYVVKRGTEEVYRGYFFGARNDGLFYFGKRKEEWDTAFNKRYFKFSEVEDEY